MLASGFAQLHGGRSAAGSCLRRRRRVRVDAARLVGPVAARVGWREIDGGWFPGTVVGAAVLGGPAKKKVAKATHIVEFKKKEGGAQGHGGQGTGEAVDDELRRGGAVATPRSSRSPLPKASACH